MMDFKKGQELLEQIKENLIKSFPNESGIGDVSDYSAVTGKFLEDRGVLLVIKIFVKDRFWENDIEHYCFCMQFKVYPDKLNNEFHDMNREFSGRFGIFNMQKYIDNRLPNFVNIYLDKYPNP